MTSTATIRDKKVNVVYSTQDYDRFIFREDNRTIKPNHLKELTEKMKAFGWVPGSQIEVNEKNEVIDGQHRLLAAKEAGIPFLYIIEKDAGFNEIQLLNQTQVNWNKIDHVHAWIKRGNPHYQVLQDFLTDHPNFKITEAIMLLMNEFTSISRTDFEGGNFKVKDREIAEKWVNCLNQLKPYFEEGYNKSMFVRAMVKLFARKPVDFNFEEFLHKAELRPSMIYLCGSTDLYIEMIEKLYNYKRQKKVNLRIFD